MKKLVKVEIAFDLMNKGDVYEADVNDARTKSLLQVGYISVVETPQALLIAQTESDLRTESAPKAGAPAPRSVPAKKTSGKVQD